MPIKKPHNDRFLQLRHGRYQYVRRVPKSAVPHEPRAPVIRMALKTEDLAVARLMRDKLERADDKLWAAYILEERVSESIADHKRAVRRAEALGLRYRTVEEIAEHEPMEGIAERMDILAKGEPAKELVEAVIGLKARPKVTLKDALKVYLEEIKGPELRKMSAQQQRKYRVIPERAVRTFTSVVGKRAIDDISREDAQAFYKYWRERVAPTQQGKEPSHSASSANRQIGELRNIYGAYFSWMNEPDRLNPFKGLSFSEKGKRVRQPFPTEWIGEKILDPEALKGLNEEARGILLVLVETGARLSEICNLRPHTILLDAVIPHISIEPSGETGSPRQLKTEHSARKLPLVGVALEAMRQFPEGFARYREKEDGASAAINSYMRANGLMPDKGYTLYRASL